MDEDEGYSFAGYVAKTMGLIYGGLPAVGAIFYTVKNGGPDFDLERLCSAVVIGGLCYFVGDRMHSRELEEHKVSLLEERTGVLTKEEDVENFLDY